MLDRHLAKEISAILFFAIASAFAVNFFSPAGIALVGEWDTSRGVVTAKSKNDVVDHELELDISEARNIYFLGKSIFVDARVSELYEEGHIRNAISLPVNQFDDLVETFMADCPPSASVVTYCTGRECEDAHQLARYLSEAGYSDIQVYADGYGTWKEEGYPVEE